MGAYSDIEWTDATWNPVTGCSIVSPGCAGCYAMKLAGTRMRNHPSRRGLTVGTKTGPVWTGEVRFIEKWLLQPLEWTKPRKIFVCAHGDLFHENVPDEWIDRVFAAMALATWHTMQVLTKRSARMREYLSDAGVRERIAAEAARIANSDPRASELHANAGLSETLPKWPLPNVWLGVSAEDQWRADERIPDLLGTPAAARFLSAEPLLGPIDLRRLMPGGVQTLDALAGLSCDPGYAGWAKLDLVIAGGEGGYRARPMHPDWPRNLRDQCAAAAVPFFFKQWGEHLPVGQHLPGFGKVHGATAVKPGRMKLHCGGSAQRVPKHAFAERGVEAGSTVDGLLTCRVGKTRAGALLDGKLHRAFPVRP